jgi:transcriptional regulator with XRE-family HTH domain
MASSRATLAASSFTDFGTLLRVLRHRVRLTQRQLGIAVGYSEAQISRLEQGRRRPDPAVVAALFLPALRLGSEPELAARLHELALSARDGPVPGYLPERAAPATTAPAGDGVDLAAVPSLPSHYVERPAALAELRELLAAERRVVISGCPGWARPAWPPHDEARPVCGPGNVGQPLPRDEQLYLITKAMGRARMLICLDNLHLLRDEPQTRAVIEHLAGSAPAEFRAVSAR